MRNLLIRAPWSVVGLNTEWERVGWKQEARKSGAGEVHQKWRTHHLSPPGQYWRYSSRTRVQDSSSGTAPVRVQNTEFSGVHSPQWHIGATRRQLSLRFPLEELYFKK
jgi:hypothetical protein